LVNKPYNTIQLQNIVIFHFQKCFDRSRPRDDRQEGDRGSDLARSPQPEVPDRGCQDQSLGQGGRTQNAQELQDHGIGRSYKTDVSWVRLGEMRLGKLRLARSTR
jgi:hypothetical protein